MICIHFWVMFVIFVIFEQHMFYDRVPFQLKDLLNPAMPTILYV